MLAVQRQGKPCRPIRRRRRARREVRRAYRAGIRRRLMPVSPKCRLHRRMSKMRLVDKQAQRVLNAVGYAERLKHCNLIYTADC